jgi:hypothetical protein
VVHAFTFRLLLALAPLRWGCLTPALSVGNEAQRSRRPVQRLVGRRVTRGRHRLHSALTMPCVLDSASA